MQQERTQKHDRRDATLLLDNHANHASGLPS
jgi:hypothetical protein